MINFEKNAQLALDTIEMKPVKGIPSWLINPMQWSILEKLSDNPPGSYPQDPIKVYLDFQQKIGTCLLDQWIPDNPLTMKDQGYDEGTSRGATTGAEKIIRDGMIIDTPEAVIEHIEKILIPQQKKTKNNLSDVQNLIKSENEIQQLFGPNMLKCPYSEFYTFPNLLYTTYGYVNYFIAVSEYPEVMEEYFKTKAELSEDFHRNISAPAIIQGNLPKLLRLDHDMADSRGTLINIKWLDKYWFPHFTRSIQPLIDAGIRLIWHCDGNLMEMVPRLIEAGISGFQGFQYEDGMDYEKICKMTDRNGNPLFIIAGVSVTKTLPFGTPNDVKREMEWLVENGPKTGLMLGCSSSITPGVSEDNMRTLIEGLQYYIENGRQ